MGAGKNHQVTSHKSTNMDVDEAQVEEVEAPVAAEPVVESEPLDRESALKRVLKNALAHDGLARGIRECARVLDKRRVHLCVLATNCTEHAINLMEVGDNAELGEWAGLCKIDAEGNARKVVSCSCVCITDYGEQSEALDFLLKDISK